MNLRKIIAYVLFVACSFVGWYKFGWPGALLVLATWVAACTFCGDNVHDDEHEDEPEHDSCDGCNHNLGGGCCKLNVEDECAAGGGYELWEDE